VRTGVIRGRRRSARNCSRKRQMQNGRLEKQAKYRPPQQPTHVPGVFLQS
jgi:hypothetical protein